MAHRHNESTPSVSMHRLPIGTRKIILWLIVGVLMFLILIGWSWQVKREINVAVNQQPRSDQSLEKLQRQLGDILQETKKNFGLVAATSTTTSTPTISNDTSTNMKNNLETGNQQASTTASTTNK